MLGDYLALYTASLNGHRSKRNALHAKDGLYLSVVAAVSGCTCCIVVEQGLVDTMRC